MYYIAYGSNLNLDHMARCCPDSEPVGKGTLHGWKLVFNRHADIIETSDPADTVPVLLWRIGKFDWPILDAYEGYPFYYEKREIPTALETGEIVPCVAYVMTEDCKGLHPPTDGYFDIIARGCEQNGFPTNHLRTALAESRASSSENPNDA